MPTRLHFAALFIVLALTGCEAPMPTMSQLKTQAVGGEAIAIISYQSPRLPLHSERFELASGTFVSRNDGMGPKGDLDFFYDGKRFYLAVNQGGGTRRAIAPLSEKPVFSTEPFALHEGDAYRVRTPEGTVQVVISRLASGSLHLTPESAGGEGQVVFNYQILPDRPVVSLVRGMSQR